MARKPVEIDEFTNTEDANAGVSTNTEAPDTMHTALSRAEPGFINMLPDDVQVDAGQHSEHKETWVTQLLSKADNVIDNEGNERMSNTAVTKPLHEHANPAPEHNRIRSSVHTDNMKRRMEAEGEQILAQVEVVDNEIARLQAERTDLMMAYSMISHALVSIE